MGVDGGRRRGGACGLAVLLGLVVLAVSPPAASETKVLLLLRPPAGTEPAWWSAEAGGKPGPLQTRLQQVLDQETGTIAPLPPPGPDPPVGGAELSLTAAAALAGQAGAHLFLLGEVVTSSLGRIELVGQEGVEVVLTATLLDTSLRPLGRGTRRQQAFAPDAAAASLLALERAAKLLAGWLQPLVQGARGTVAGPGELRVRVRGLETLAELRSLVAGLAERGAGTFRIAGAQSGEVLLLGGDLPRGLSPVIVALQTGLLGLRPVTTREEAGGLLVELGPRASEPLP